MVDGIQTADPQPEARKLPDMGPPLPEHEAAVTIPIPVAQTVLRKIKLAAGTVFRLGRQSK